jgi:hypothetical protein
MPSIRKLMVFLEPKSHGRQRFRINKIGSKNKSPLKKVQVLLAQMNQQQKPTFIEKSAAPPAAP